MRNGSPKRAGQPSLHDLFLQPRDSAQRGHKISNIFEIDRRMTLHFDPGTSCRPAAVGVRQ